MEQNNSNPNQGSQSAPSTSSNPQAPAGTPASAPTNNQNNNQNQQKPNQQQPKPMNNQQKPNQPKKVSTNNNTALWWIIAAIIVVVVIVVATKHKSAPAAPATPSQSETEDAQTTPAAADSQNESSAFADAIKSYTGKAVILGVNDKDECMALPEKLAVAAGTRVLVANNTTQQLSVEVADKKVDLDAYHYFTVSLGSALEYSVICEGQETPVASILIK
jgi:hypothetical protein